MSATAKVALHLNAAIGLACTVAASAMMSLMLTRPEALAAALAQREYGAVALAVGAQVMGWLHALLRFL